MADRIKIAYLDYSHVFAGAERVLHTIIDNIDRDRFEPLLVFPYPMEHHGRYEDLDCKRIYLADGLKWWMGSDRWKHPLRGTDFLARSIFGHRLAKSLREAKVDILHVNLLRPDSLMWLRESKKSGLKIVGHFRSQSLEWIAPRSVQSLCDIILCVSKYSRSRMLTKGEFTKSVSLYDSIEVDQFKSDLTKSEARMGLSLPLKGILLSSVGQLSRQKGHDNAIRAFAKVALARKDVYLYIAGGGVDLEYLKGIASEYPDVSDRIIFSEVHVSDIKSVYRASDVVLSLTKVGEAFGLVPYESAMMGVPFIAPEFGAVKEFITDGVNGSLVDTNDVDAIAAKIEWILSHPAETHEMVIKTQATVLSQLTPSTMSENLASVYLSLASGVDLE